MNLVTLINEDHITVASAQLVFTADESGALNSVINSAGRLETEYATARERIDKAIESGRDEGFTEGYRDGMQRGAERISAELIRLIEASQSHIEKQRADTVAIALQIVRKIASDIAPEKTLAALAQVAAQEITADETITLRVHPSFSEGVKARLSERELSDSAPARLSRVVADTTVEKFACILETRHGSVIADLETQLKLLQQSLVNESGV